MLASNLLIELPSMVRSGVGSGTLETTIVGVESNDRSDLKSTVGLFGGRQVMYTAANGLNPRDSRRRWHVES